MIWRTSCKVITTRQIEQILYGCKILGVETDFGQTELLALRLCCGKGQLLCRSWSVEEFRGLGMFNPPTTHEVVAATFREV